jgi:hypothetical protein
MHWLPLGFANLDSEKLARSQYASCDWQIRLSISIISFCRRAHILLTPNTTLQFTLTVKLPFNFVKFSHNIFFELQNLKILKNSTQSLNLFPTLHTQTVHFPTYLTFIHIPTPYLVSSLLLSEGSWSPARGQCHNFNPVLPPPPPLTAYHLFPI